MKKIFKYILTFLILFLMFNILLFAGSTFPSSIIKDNVKESSKTLSQEGNYYIISKYFGNENDNYTDSIMINEAYSIDNTNPIYSYLAVRKNYENGITQKYWQDTQGELISINNLNDYDPVGELAEFLDGNIDTSITYARYWHGYLPILRTLLIFFNITEIRRLLLIIFIILFIYFIWLLKKKLGLTISLIFALALVFEGYFFASYSLENAPIFLVMMVSGIILLQRIEKMQNFYLYIFIVACITNFVDYLTVPLITLAIPLYIFILYKQQKEPNLDYKYYLKITIKTTIIWGLGYAITWLSKWAIYDILYGGELIKSAINQIMYRTQSTNVKTKLTIDIVLENFLAENLAYIDIIGFIIILISLPKIKKYKLKLNSIDGILNKTTIPVIIISLMPIFWYVLLSNHTVIHWKFVYRHMIIFLIGMLICLRNMFNLEKNKK